MTTLFISGIDTDIGKSMATAALANTLIMRGYQLLTQKWIETGCNDDSQDLLTHQQHAPAPFNTGDKDLHSPYRFKYAASPHLAAQLENRLIDSDYLISQTQQLATHCEHLLVEGAGGLCVPLNSERLIIDVIGELNLPVILVTSGKLGSINHTILSIEQCRQKNIEIRAIIYNHYPNHDSVILNDTRSYLQRHLANNNLLPLWLELRMNSPTIDLSQQQIEKMLH